MFEQVSKKGAVAAATALLIGVGSYLTTSFGVLPAEWAWLKPAIEFISQKYPEVAKALK